MSLRVHIRTLKETPEKIFVGALDESVTEDVLKSVFGQFGELVHVKIPAGKRCGFVQYAIRGCAEQALNSLNGTQLGGQSIRLSWGRTPSNKQTQPDQAQYGGGGGGYYGYPPQGYEGYGYAPPPQDPNAYYGGYPGAGYGNYQQPGGYQQHQQHDVYVVIGAEVPESCLFTFRDGSVFSGVFYTASFENGFGIVLKNAKMIKKGKSKANVASGSVVETLVIMSANIVQVVAEVCPQNEEQALNSLNGTQLGGQSIRLSWGRTPSNKQTQPEQAQYGGGGGGYYGYPPQGYEGYGYVPPPQDPNAYYGGYPGAGYGNYQQPGGYQQHQQVINPSVFVPENLCGVASFH
ncbi:hypothetical protein F2Q68_00037475 [Brassica cretica]|uniref:RRM domain-containing protein n=1 Tax=Brassica cretica TaxID=69181 RepID=A0A8S9H5G0_BRACR|nr:hypothetical protein F2Q68_00037475 [Brassica cretica]